MLGFLEGGNNHSAINNLPNSLEGELGSGNLQLKTYFR